MSWALSQQIVTSAPARHVLLCLANYADQDGKTAFPSVARLERDTGLSERTIRAKLKDLEQMGVLIRGNQSIVEAYVERSDKLPICYNINLKRGAANAPRSERGAGDSTTGCISCSDGVQEIPERGAGAAGKQSYKQSIKQSINHVSDSEEKNKYSNDFEEVWASYPSREGSNPKNKAHAAWSARIKEGVSRETLLAGVKRYALFCIAKNQFGTEFVMQAARFFGTNREYENPWIPPPPTPTKGGGYMNGQNPSEIDYQKGVGDDGKF